MRGLLPLIYNRFRSAKGSPSHSKGPGREWTDQRAPASWAAPQSRYVVLGSARRPHLQLDIGLWRCFALLLFLVVESSLRSVRSRSVSQAVRFFQVWSWVIGFKGVWSRSSAVYRASASGKFRSREQSNKFWSKVSEQSFESALLPFLFCRSLLRVNFLQCPISATSLSNFLPAVGKFP